MCMLVMDFWCHTGSIRESVTFWTCHVLLCCTKKIQCSDGNQIKSIHGHALQSIQSMIMRLESCQTDHQGPRYGAKGELEMFYSNLVTGPTVLIWENARCLATGGPMKIPRPGSSRTRSVAQFMNLKQCYLRKLYSWYVLPQLGQKCFLNYICPAKFTGTQY